MKLRYCLFALILLPQIALADCWDQAKTLTSQSFEKISP